MRTSGVSGPIRGIATNSNAAAGNIGEYIFDQVLKANEVSLTSGAALTVIGLTSSKTLTPGDWDVEGTVIFDPSATAAITVFLSCISLTTNTLSGGDEGAMAQHSTASNTEVQNTLLPTPTRRVTVAAGATQDVFLVGFGLFSSTVTVSGFIRARRAANTG